VQIVHNEKKQIYDWSYNYIGDWYFGDICLSVERQFACEKIPGSSSFELFHCQFYGQLKLTVTMARFVSKTKHNVVVVCGVLL